jgi:trafficking protein particle complex subunit 9
MLPPWSELPTPLDFDKKKGSKSPLPSTQAAPSSFTLSTAPVLKRTSAANSIKRQSSLSIPTKVKKRHSGIGVASSLGRLFKILADFFLLAGRTEDATVWYTESLQYLKSQDVIWHASALEGLATVSVLDAWSAGQGLVSFRLLRPIHVVSKFDFKFRITPFPPQLSRSRGRM